MIGKISAYQAYSAYMGVKLHFTSNYDYAKYQGSVKTNAAKFESSNKQYHMWYRLGKDWSDAGEFASFVAVTMFNAPTPGKIWVGDLVKEEAKAKYLEWQAWNEAFTYRLGNGLSDLHAILATEGITLAEAVTPFGGELPFLFNLYTKKRIPYQVLVALNGFSGGKLFAGWNTRLEEDAVWNMKGVKLAKFATFFPALYRDKEKITAIMKKVIDKQLENAI